METELPTVASWQPVGSAARTTVEAGRDYCAVYDVDGDVTALLPVDALLDTARRRPELRVDEIVRRLPPLRRAGLGDDLAAAIEHAGGALPIAVFRDRQLVGAVTRASLERALRHRRIATPTA